MKKNTLKLSIYAVMLLSSTLAIADDEFPAADFQPKVIFENSGASTAAQPSSAPASEASTTDSNYPAADYQPKVLYQNDAANTDSSPKKTVAEAPVAIDTEHPAADFQPKVLFSDPNHKPTPLKGTQSSSGNTSAPAKVTSTSATTAPDSGDAEEASDYSLIGIGLLALIAIGLTRCKSICTFRTACTSDTSTAPIKNNGKTGVANYLDRHNKNSLSGVAKYIANKAENKPTGVENYLRKRG